MEVKTDVEKEKMKISEGKKIDKVKDIEEPNIEDSMDNIPDMPRRERHRNVKGKKNKKRRSGKSFFVEMKAWIQDLLVAFLIAILLYQLVTPTIVKEHSMEDTLYNNEYLLLWKMGARMGKTPDYGDIVVFRSNLLGARGKNDKLLIKRVIGLPGDLVSIKDGVVYRNREALDEPYTKDGFTTGGMDESIVPPGTLFLLGDNRAVSIDSRSEAIGFVDEGRLVGKAVFRLYPFNRIGNIYGNYK